MPPHKEIPAMRLVLPLALLLALPARAADDDKPNVAPEGFKSLFDGKTLTGWKVLGKKIDGWAVDETAGTFHTTPKGGGGWLMSEKEYGNFELRLQFKVPK